MGSREKNFYNTLVRQYGFEREAAEIQDLYLDGKREEACHAVPDALIDLVSLVGPRERVADRLAAFREAGVGTLIASPVAASKRIRSRRCGSWLSWRLDPTTQGLSRRVRGSGARLPDARPGRTVGGARSSGDLRDLGALRPHVTAAGMGFVAAPEYQVFPPAGKL